MDQMVMEHDLDHFNARDYDEVVLQSPHGYAGRTIWSQARPRLPTSSWFPPSGPARLVVLVANPDNEATVERVRQTLGL
jgi:hypothetical protein